MRKFFTHILATLLLVTGAANSATLQVDSSGKLTGAKGVTVLGSTYDVYFADGSCYALFNLCNGSDDFVFNTQASALAASEALLSQVFIGTYDTQPDLTNYIAPSTTYASVVTPYGLNSSRLDIAFAQHSVDETYDYVLASYLPSTITDLRQYGADVFAIWSPSTTGNSSGTENLNPTAVPEPETYALMLSGLGLVGAIARRRKAKQAA